MSSYEHTRCKLHHQVGIALFFPLLLTVTIVIFLSATPSRAVGHAQAVQARVVHGVLPGGQSAQIWLGLIPEFADAQIKVIAEWDRPFPAANGLNFFIFDEQQLRRLDDGRASFSAIALAAGSPRFELTTPDYAIGAGFNATGWAAYALVLVNESAADATFTLRVTNAFVTDTAMQVTALDEAVLPMPLPTITTTLQPPTALLTTPGFITTTTLFTVWPPSSISPVTGTVTGTVTVSVPITTGLTTTALTTTALTTTLVTTPVNVVATATPVDAPISPRSLPIAPQARTGLGSNKRFMSVSGVLATIGTQQILRLQPTKAQGQILLGLVADEQGGALPTTTDALNFWVFDEAGFSQYLTGTSPTTVAVSIGKPVFRSPTNERAAGFRSTTLQPYTVVIYSEVTLPVTYTFRVAGAQIIENFYVP